MLEGQMLQNLDKQTARAMLEWQVELGADEAICDAPIDRFAIGEPPVKLGPTSNLAPLSMSKPVPTFAAAGPEIAQMLAAPCNDLAALRSAMAVFDHCDLKKGARNLVFSDGNPQARVMIIGEAPDRDEDRIGKPFVGAAGQLLDKMFAAIGLSRQAQDSGDAIYITNILPWRPPQNREPEATEIAMMLPFMRKHIELVAPEFIVLMGNTACQSLMGRRGISRLRGQWDQVFGVPTLPMLHPDYLLRTPLAKRQTWADLQALQKRLKT
jgi:uracil-DNA glycosylase family 4